MNFQKGALIPLPYMSHTYIERERESPYIPHQTYLISPYKAPRHKDLQYVALGPNPLAARYHDFDRVLIQLPF